MSRLISLFRSLTIEEVKQFGQFFRSPYYNATPKMRALYKHLKKAYPECIFTDEDKQKLFVQIFDNKVYNLKKMNNLMASLSSILQDFLLLQNMKHGTTARRRGLFEVYRDRKLNKSSRQQLVSIKKDFEELGDKDTVGYYEVFRVNHDLYFHPQTKRVKWKEKEDYDYLEAAQENLDLFYAHQRLHHLCEMIFRGNSGKTSKLTPEEEHSIAQLVEHHDAPLLEIYQLLYAVLNGAGKETYGQLKKCTFNYIDNYNPFEFNYLITFLKNYQVSLLVAGDTDALRENFDLYRFGLRKGIYMKEAKNFPLGHFVNICVLASELEEVDWLEEFIEQRQDDLRMVVKENTVNLARAFLHFAKHEYDEALRLSMMVKNAEPAYALTCWTLEIRAYYMMQDKHYNWDASIKKFYNYLRNQKDLEKNIITANRNFNAFVRSLYRATYDNTTTKEQLLAKLESRKNIVCKYWLKKQIEKF